MNNLKIENNILTLSLNKKDINSFIERVVTEVKEGNRNPLETLVKLKAITKVADGITNNIMEDTISEALKYEKNEKAYGAKIDVREAGVKYDYSQSQTWRELIEERNALDERIKAIEFAYRNATPDTPYIDTITGEVFTIPPTKHSKTVVAVSF